MDLPRAVRKLELQTLLCTKIAYLCYPRSGTAHLMARLLRPLSCCRALLLAASSCMFAFKLDEAACCCVSRLHATSSMLATEGRRRNVPSEIAYHLLVCIMLSS